jgi:DNA-binding response OmpR family regulator
MKKILIIEDNTELRENTAEILELAGFDVITAPHGKEGVRLANSESPDLIVCDIMMPELDGYGVKQLLGQNERLKNVPFIFLTAKADRTDFRKGMSLGADDYLTKPFDESDLLNSIKIRLEKSENLNKNVTLSGFNYSTLITKAIENKKTLNYQKKDILFREFDKAYHVYYIKKGKAKSYKINDDGKEFIFEIFSQGDIIGMWDVLKGEDYFLSVAAIEELEVVRISKDEIQKLLENNYDAAINLIEIMSKDIQDKEERIVQLAYDTVRMRVASALINLYDLFTDEKGNSSFKIAREDLAAMVGTSTESVIRTLSDFKKEELIHISNNEISIKNIQALRNFRF